MKAWGFALIMWGARFEKRGTSDMVRSCVFKRSLWAGDKGGASRGSFSELVKRMVTWTQVAAVVRARIYVFT